MTTQPNINPKTTATVQRIIAEATQAAAKSVYNSSEEIIFGFHPTKKAWRAIVVNSWGAVIEQAETTKCDALLDDVFKMIESRGTKLLIVVGEIAKRY